MTRASFRELLLEGAEPASSPCRPMTCSTRLGPAPERARPRGRRNTRRTQPPPSSSRVRPTPKPRRLEAATEPRLALAFVARGRLYAARTSCSASTRSGEEAPRDLACTPPVGRWRLRRRRGLDRGAPRASQRDPVALSSTRTIDDDRAALTETSAPFVYPRASISSYRGSPSSAERASHGRRVGDELVRVGPDARDLRREPPSRTPVGSPDPGILAEERRAAPAEEHLLATDPAADQPRSSSCLRPPLSPEPAPRARSPRRRSPIAAGSACSGSTPPRATAARPRSAPRRSRQPPVSGSVPPRWPV